jgi:hypothetical protein
MIIITSVESPQENRNGTADLSADWWRSCGFLTLEGLGAPLAEPEIFRGSNGCSNRRNHHIVLGVVLLCTE